MKHVLTLMTVVIAGFAIAQKSNTTNAAMAYKSYESVRFTDFEQAAKDLLEAKSYIDLSINHDDTKNDPKTLMYYGKIYIEIPFCAQTSGDETLKSFDGEECYTIGFDAFEKSKKADTKKMYEDDINEYCGFYRAMLSNAGITMYDEGKFEEAMGGLLGAAMFGDAMGVKDSFFYFYGGIAAYKIEKYEEASKAFSETVAIGYQPAASVSYLTSCLVKLGKKEDAEKMLNEQVAKHPDNKDIMIELINFYIDSDRKPEAIKILNDAIALDPNNPILIYTAGTIYENMGDFENAEKSYLKAQELGDKNAGFALGSLYFNKGADLYTGANALAFGSPEYNDKYEPMIEESKVFFNKAVPYLEKAADENPNDLVILEALKAAYGKVGNTEKFIELKKKIESIKAGQ